VRQIGDPFYKCLVLKRISQSFKSTKKLCLLLLMSKLSPINNQSSPERPSRILFYSFYLYHSVLLGTWISDSLASARSQNKRESSDICVVELGCVNTFCSCSSRSCRISQASAKHPGLLIHCRQCRESGKIRLPSVFCRSILTTPTEPFHTRLPQASY